MMTDLKKSLEKTTFVGFAILLGIIIGAVIYGEFKITAEAATYILLVFIIYFIANAFWVRKNKKT